jgi:hypothetical protein
MVLSRIPIAVIAAFPPRRLMLAIILLSAASSTAFSQDSLGIWREFVSLVRSGGMTVDRIRPYQELENAKAELLRYLVIAREQALPEEWETKPEIIRRDDTFHYIITLTTNHQKVPYCFSIITENNQWYFRHVESIFIRLDTLSSFPTSVFPDVEEPKKAWMREETYWSFVVLNVYLPITRDRGKDYALSLLKDGAGYYLGAKAWVPFERPHRAFILYLCWEQAHLRNNGVTLVSLSDTSSVVEIQSHFFALYDIAAHLKPVISEGDYRQIFETIWHDRAKNAGWALDVTYLENYSVRLHFHRGI